ncbi:MAG: transglycosylase SLT domain-containing protein, partial [Acidimicrobiales bacterium]
MSSPTTTASIEEVPSPQRTAHRSRKGWRAAAALVAVVGLALATSACSPEAIAKDAIKKNWSRLSPCAERVVQRESNFQADAVNPSSGTTGLFQIHPTHASWIKATFGYDFSEMKDPYKNAQVARELSNRAYRYWGDGWQPWRLSGRAIHNGGCPA